MSMRYTSPNHDVVINADGCHRVLERLGFKSNSVFDELKSKEKREEAAMGTKRAVVKDANGTVTREIKGGYTLVYGGLADGKFAGTLNKDGAEIAKIVAKTEKSIVSSAYHKAQKLEAPSAKVAKE